MKTVIKRSAQSIQRNSPSVFAGLAVGGVVSTAYLAARAGYYTGQRLSSVDSEMETKEKVELTWKLYIPTAIMGAVTVGSIVMSVRSGNRRTTAMAAAYSLSERAFHEYRDRVIEEIGEKKEAAMRAELVEEKVASKPPEIAIVSDGKMLTCELHTMRYFHTTMQDLKNAQNQINHRIVNDLWVSLDELYDILGLEHTSNSDMLGWDSDKLLEFDISAVLTPDGEPCVAFAYNYLKAL